MGGGNIEYITRVTVTSTTSYLAPAISYSAYSEIWIKVTDVGTSSISLVAEGASGSIDLGQFVNNAVARVFNFDSGVAVLQPSTGGVGMRASDNIPGVSGLVGYSKSGLSSGATVTFYGIKK
jgi:hypothetical protein